ncbi:MAG: hypothetical protein AAFO04_14985 [Cyanobacteria bacterium J06592_8]
MNKKLNKSQLAQTHRANLQKRLEQRLEVARSKGDQNLIELLEAEKQQLQ